MKKFQSFSVSLGRKKLCRFFDFFPVAGLQCPVPGRHRRPPRCPLHRSGSKKFQSFSVSLGRKRLCHFFDFLPVAGLPCPVRRRHRRPPRCHLHRSRSKKFQSFSVSLVRQGLCHFYSRLNCCVPRCENRSPPPPASPCNPADDLTDGPISRVGRLGDRRFSERVLSDSRAPPTARGSNPCMY